MYYFAYGSNMLTARLARRVPSARPVGAAWLAGHRLCFDLRGSDGSGKCNALPTGSPADVVHGVLFELAADRLDRLHAAEGPAYVFVELEVGTAAGACTAATYRGRAAWLAEALTPFDWYLDFVVAGAQAHGLPDRYIDWLAQTPSIADADRQRAAGNRQILHEQPANVRMANAGGRRT